MGMLQETVRNLKKLANATKATGVPSNIGVTYTIDPVKLLVSGSFTLQLKRVDDDDSHNFSFDVIDFVAPLVSTFSLTEIKPNSIFTLNYNLSDVQSQVTAAKKPSWVLLTDGATNAINSLQAVTFNDSYYIVGVDKTNLNSILKVQLNNLPAGKYQLSLVADSDVTNASPIKSFPFEVKAA